MIKEDDQSAHIFAEDTTDHSLCDLLLPPLTFCRFLSPSRHSAGFQHDDNYAVDTA